MTEGSREAGNLVAAHMCLVCSFAAGMNDPSSAAMFFTFGAVAATALPPKRVMPPPSDKQMARMMLDPAEAERRAAEAAAEVVRKQRRAITRPAGGTQEGGWRAVTKLHWQEPQPTGWRAVPTFQLEAGAPPRVPAHLKQFERNL